MKLIATKYGGFYLCESCTNEGRKWVVATNCFGIRKDGRKDFFEKNILRNNVVRIVVEDSPFDKDSTYEEIKDFVIKKKLVTHTMKKFLGVKQ